MTSAARDARPRCARAAPGFGGFAALGLALALAGAGCGGRDDTPTAPGTGALPPIVTAVSPPPRSVGVPYDTTSIWAEFSEPLDPASVTTLNVYLKVDTRRQAIAVRWEAGPRRIRIVPAAPLVLRTTYTVELSPNLRAADGRALGARVLWQFSTNSLGRPSSPSPPPGAAPSSPFVTLGWSGNAISSSIVYDLYTGVDSTQVALRAMAPRARSILLHHVPRTRWPEGARLYWAVTAERLDTGERFDGPVWGFETLPQGAPVDSMSLITADYAWNNQGSAITRCLGPELVSAPTTMAALRWLTSAVPADVRVAGVRFVLTSTATHEANLQSGASVWAALGPWACNQVRYPGPPFVDEPGGALATGVVGGRTIEFSSDALTAHFEALVRRGDVYGYVIRSPLEVRYMTPVTGGTSEVPRLVLYYYRPAGPAR